jgi:aminoglycoside phosphotransferase (APT) family kinase protein
MTPGTPPAELHIDDRLVRGLLRQQHPDLAGAPLMRIDVGWDNVVYRLGDDHGVRLPRRQAAVALIENEQKWLPLLAERLPVAVPQPVRVGRPNDDYPWPWSITRWLAGAPADLAPPGAAQASRLAAFLRALHRPGPPDAPRNPVRGVPLQQRVVAGRDRLDRLHALADVAARITPAVRRRWETALAAPPATEAVWLHGDLHARNVLVTDGAICGVIDWGDMTTGDPATDLAVVWSLFDDRRARARCLDEYGATSEMRARAAGWAVLFGSMLLETGRIDHPRHLTMGEAIMRRVDEDG